MADPNTIQQAVGGTGAPGAPAGMPPGMAPGGSPGPAGMGGFDEPNQSQELAGLDRRMRVLEERFANLRKRYQIDEQNQLKHQKKLNAELKGLAEENRNLRAEILEMRNKFKILINELKLYATKEEIKVLEKYVNMWEPVTFVTRTESENIVRRVVEDEYGQAKTEKTTKPTGHTRHNMHLR